MSQDRLNPAGSDPNLPLADRRKFLTGVGLAACLRAYSYRHAGNASGAGESGPVQVSGRNLPLRQGFLESKT